MVMTRVQCIVFFMMVIVICGIETTAPYPYIENLGCAVYPKIVPADPNYRYATYYIELQRCQGADSNPSRRICESTSRQEYYIRVFDPTTSTLATIPVYNDTSCTQVCRNNVSACDVTHEDWDEDTCSCKCRRNETEVVDCGKDKIWDRTGCSCVCKHRDVKSDECRNKGGTWNSETCGCAEKEACAEKLRNPCNESKGIAAKYVVMIVVLENIVVLTVCAIVVRIFFWNNHKKRDGDIVLN